MATEYIIHNLMIRPDGLCEIQYANDTDERKDAALLRVLVFMPDRFPKEMAEVMDDLNTLIDEVERYRTGPEDQEPFRPPDPQLGPPPQPSNGTSTTSSSSDFDAENF